MPTHTYSPVRGKRIRVTALDECGRVPAAGTANSWLATDGFITVSLSAEVEDGDEIIQKNANGALCVNERSDSSFKNFTVSIEFCGVNPSLLALVSNAETYLDHAGDVAGITVDEGVMTKKFALELWTGLAGQACGAGADEASGYMLLPFVAGGVLGDLEVNGTDATTFSIDGAFTKGGNGWGVGPYQVVYDETNAAAFLPTALAPTTHFLLLDTGLALPPVAAEPQPMPTNGTTTTTTTTVV